HVIYLSNGGSGTPLEWVDGAVRPVAVDESGVERTGSFNLDGSGGFQWGYRAVPNTISRDGRRIFFQSTDELVSTEDGPGQDVYVRQDGETTRIVSPRRGAAGVMAVTFAGASDDGDIAYMTSTGALTGDS